MNDQQRTGRKTTTRVPTFKNLEEEAEFWDAHNLAEFEDDWTDETGQVKFVPAGTKRGLTVRLDDETLARLKTEAKEKGIGPSTLVRMWILERLKESSSGQSR